MSTVIDDDEATTIDMMNEYLPTREQLEKMIAKVDEEMKKAVQEEDYVAMFSKQIEFGGVLIKIREILPLKDELELKIGKLKTKIEKIMEDKRGYDEVANLKIELKYLEHQLTRNKRTREEVNTVTAVDTIDDSGEKKIRVDVAESHRNRNSSRHRYDRITFFQSAPLVCEGKDGKACPFHPLPDFEKENELLRLALDEKENDSGKIDVFFERATTDSLSSALTSGKSSVIHFLCHGDKDALLLEDGWGFCHRLSVEDLRDFVSAGKKVKLVFVAACHSEDAGRQFLAAGIPYVVCCQRKHQLLDKAAYVFTLNFYRALACGLSLKDAFQHAKNTVRTSPKINNSRDESEKFLLLSEKDEDVQIFFTDEKKELCISRAQEPSSSVYPPTPFLGREYDMYRILHKLKSNVPVEITGPPGIGKSSLGQAVYKYITDFDRYKCLALQSVIWLDSIQDETVREYNFNHMLVVFDTRNIVSDTAHVKLKELLDRITASHNAKLLVVRHSPQNPLIGYSAVRLKPISFRSSVELFAERQNSSELESSSELVNVLMSNVLTSHAEANEVNETMSERLSEIFKIVGEGIPGQICSNATSKDNYDKLMCIGKKPEFSCRSELEKVITDKEIRYNKARKNYLLADAGSLERDLEELKSFRNNLFTMDELEEKLRILEGALKKSLAWGTLHERHKKYVDERDNLKIMIQQEKAFIDAETPRTFSIMLRSFKLVANYGSVVNFNYKGKGPSAVVCATTELVEFSPGVAKCIGEAGGKNLADDVSKLPVLQETVWGRIRCWTGDAKIIGTSTGDCRYDKLKCKYVIFAVGPTYDDNDYDEKLRKTYVSCLTRAKEKNLEAVGFSLISSGIRAGPNWERPIQVCMNTLTEYAENAYESLKEVHIFAFRPEEFEVLESKAGEMKTKVNS